MISRKKLAERIAEKRKGIVGTEIPEEMLSYVFGGCAPEDFCQSFNDAYVDNGIGPTFIDNFTDRFPFGNSRPDNSLLP